MLHNFHVIFCRCGLTCPSWPTCTWWIWRFPWNREETCHVKCLMPLRAHRSLANSAISTSKHEAIKKCIALLLAFICVDLRFLNPAQGDSSNNIVSEWTRVIDVQLQYVRSTRTVFAGFWACRVWSVSHNDTRGRRERNVFEYMSTILSFLATSTLL